jgi:hypothetical protein
MSETPEAMPGGVPYRAIRDGDRGRYTRYFHEGVIAAAGRLRKVTGAV